MGKVKEFASFLSKCIYKFDLSDERIMYVLKSQNDQVCQDEIELWIRDQIKVVRKNPQIYKDMAD